MVAGLCEDMPFCPKCGKDVQVEASFCPSCGYGLKEAAIREGFIVVTTPTVPGYRVKKVLGVVSGLTARTRGVGGKVIAGIQSVFGGEVSAFTSEMEKARIEAIERAEALGLRAVFSPLCCSQVHEDVRAKADPS